MHSKLRSIFIWLLIDENINKLLHTLPIHLHLACILQLHKNLLHSSISDLVSRFYEVCASSFYFHFPNLNASLTFFKLSYLTCKANMRNMYHMSYSYSVKTISVSLMITSCKITKEKSSIIISVSIFI